MSVEFVGIQLELMGEEGVISALKQIDALARSLGGKKKVNLELRQIERDLIAARAQLRAYKKDQEGLAKGSTGWQIVQGYIEETKDRIAELTTASNVARAALKTMGDTFQQSFNKANSVLTHIGSRMQSFGNAMTRLTSPFERITTGLLYGVGYKALNTITEGFSQSFARADTISKYTKMMAEYETAAYSVEQSRKDLDESVQGLPIALDEAMSLAQRYTLSLGDMERGTKLAIATNNAFLASMATETQRYQGMLQLQDLMNGKDLQPREWMSLGSSMGKAINEVGKKLGYGTDELGKFRQELYAGNIATEDFLNALIKVGTGEGKLVEIAKLNANTWEGLFFNIKTAAARMGESVIKTLNTTFEKATGRSLLLTLLGRDAEGNDIGGGVKHWIDGMAKSVRGWIRANPDKILDFFNTLKSIDWGGFIKGLAQGVGDMMKIIKGIADLFAGTDMSKLGRRMIRANLLGKGLTIFGGILKGISAFPAGIYATIKTLKRAKGAAAGGSLFDAIGVLLGDKDIDKAAGKMTKAGGSMGKFSLGLSKFFKGWAEIAVMIGGSAFVAWGSMKLFKGTVKSFKEMVDILNEVDWDMGKKALGGIGAFLTAVAGLSALAGKFADKSGVLLVGEVIVGLFTTLAVGFASLDMYFIKDTVKNARDAVDYLNQTIEKLGEVKEVPNVKKKIGKAIKALNEITNLFRGDFNVDTKQYEGGLRYFGKKYANSMKNLENALKSVDAVNKLKIDSSNIETNMTALGDALESIGNMLDEMPTTLKDEESQTWSENVKVAMQNVHQAFKALTAGDGILTQLPMITGAIHQINLDTVKTEFKKLGQVFDEIQGNLEGVGADTSFSERINNFREGLKQMRLAIHHLGEMGSVDMGGLDAGVANIRTALSKLRGVFNNVDGLVEDITSFTDSIKAALDQLKALSAELVIDATVKLSDSFQSSVDNVIKTIKKGKADIKAQERPAVKLSIPVTVTFSVSTNLGSALSIIWSAIASIRSAASSGGSSRVSHEGSDAPYRWGHATGGMIYRSGGGSIFKPKGTDTVPAMLTPGEYVHNRRAVNLFGIDFMRKVNNLDMKGAMDELMIRAGNMVGAGQSTTINNYYNNNQKVVQNINTNSPDFAFRTASRFVGAF